MTDSKFVSNNNLNNIEENSENTRIQNEEEITLYYNNPAETITYTIIDKIISFTITKIHLKEIYKNIGNHCFNYIKELIFPYLKSNFITHEIRHYEKEKLFFDMPKVKKHNTWIEIEEPKNPISDRYCLDQLKYNEYIPIEFEVIKSSNISNTDILYIDKDNSLYDNINISINENIGKKSRNISKKPTEISNKNISRKITKIEVIEEKKENKIKEKIIDFPSYDLPEELYTNEYLKNDNTEELIELRKEREIEIKKKEEQKKKDEENKRKEFNNIIKEKIKVKDLDGKKYTFDSNGKIIKIKSKITIESNLGNEFYWSKPITKDIRTFRQSQKIPRKSVNHNMKNRKLDDFTKGIIPAKSTKNLDSNFNIDEDEEEEKFNKFNNRRSSLKIGKNTIKKIREESEIIRNPNDEDLFKRKNKLKILEKKNDYIIPSGQNFDIMIPEVGVTIINEKKKKKIGGFNFSEKFNKPSMEEFSKLAFDTENLNSKRFLSGSLSHKKILSDSNVNNTNDNNKNNYIGYSKEFNNDNPLIQNAHPIILNKRNSFSQNNILNHDNLNYNKSELMNEIKLSKKLNNVINLKSIFNENDENKNFKSYKNLNIKSMRPTGSNIFRRNISGNLFKFKTEENNYDIINEKKIDKFNFKIVKDRNWGLDNDQFNNKNNYFVKPHKNNHIKELGVRIVNIKLPRDRKFAFNNLGNNRKNIDFKNNNDNNEKEKENKNNDNK